MIRKKSNNMQKIVSAFILWCMTIGSIAGIFTANVGSGSVPEPVPMLVPSVIDGTTFEIRDWGTYDADFSITIQNGGTLRIINSTLNFLQDDFTNYNIAVNSGSTLEMQNSTITTGATPQAMWDPMFDMDLTDATFKMGDHSVLAFPGTLTVTNTLTYINDSWITSLAPTIFFSEYANSFPTFKGVVDDWWTGTPRSLDDSQDDGPAIRFLNCNDVTIADSRIDDMYEDANLIVPTQNIQIVPSGLTVSQGVGNEATVQNLDGSRYLLNYAVDLTPEISAQFTPIAQNPDWTDQNFQILAAYLYVVYINPSYTYASGYDVTPWNYFNISGPIPEWPVFQIEQDMTSDWAVEEEITAQIYSFDQINQMNVNFTAYEFGANDPLSIDIIALNLTILPLHPEPAQQCSILADNSEISMINSYMDADWTSAFDNYDAKNAIMLTNGANLYMYNVTIDEDDNGNGVHDFLEIPYGASPQDYVPVNVESGSEAYYFKWLDMSVTDRYAAAIPGARLNLTFHFTDATTVNTVSKINDLNDYTGPNEWDWAKLRMTNYLNRMYGTAAATFDYTNSAGKAVIPLLTTYFNATNYPNGDHVGEYDVNIVFAGSAGGFAECDFWPMPNIAADYNTEARDVQLTDVELARPFGSPGLIVNGTMVMNMNGGVSDSLAITDFIIVEDNGRLTISNANMMMSPTGAAPFHITVRDSGQLILDNVDLRTQNSLYMMITLEDNAAFTMIDSTTTNVIDILAKDNVQVLFNRSEIGGQFDTADEAGTNVRLNAWSTMFGRNLNDLYGTTEVRLIGCYSPLSPNFKVEPMDSAKVWNYRWAEVTVYNGQTPAKTLPNADVWITTQYTGLGTMLNRAGTTNSAGVYLTYALSDYLYYSPAASEVVESHYNLYTLYTEYQLFSGILHTDTTGLGLAAFPSMGTSDATAKRSVYLRNVLPDLDPPLTVWPLDTGSAVGRGNTVLINSTISNIGDATANGIVVRFEDIFNGQATQIYTETISTLAPGGNWPISFPYTWLSVTQIGMHNITVKVDPAPGSIPEQDETNNDNYTWIEVTSQADLAMLQYTDVWSSRTYPQTNQEFTISANIWNQGDINATGVMVWFYANGEWLGSANATEVPANPTMPTVVSIPVTFEDNGTYMIEAYIDPLNGISEVNENNNNNTMWPLSLRVYDDADLIIQALDVVEGTNLVQIANGGGTVLNSTDNRTTVTLRAMVRNLGDLHAGSVYVRFYDGAPITANLINTSAAIPSISTGNYAYATCTWKVLTNAREEVRTINAIAYGNPGLVSNTMSDTLTVRDSRPDLEPSEVELANGATEITGNTAFSLNVTVINRGLSIASKVAIDVYSSMDNYNSSRTAWNQGRRTPIGRIGNTTVATLVAGEIETFTISCTGVDAGQRSLFIFVDTELNNTDEIDYDGVTPLIGNIEERNERNNNVSFSVTATIPPLMATIALPSPIAIGTEWTQIYKEGEVQTIQISGYIVRQDSPSLGVADIPVTVTVQGMDPVYVTSQSGGFYSTTVQVSATGNYTVTVSGEGVNSATSWFRIDPSVIFPWWIIILIIIIVVAIIVGITLYLYFVGLGKTVQCGECGAFIPEGAKKCPKCGVEFETEVAKCSVCGAWVPIDVKNCPDCGTEFTVGTEDLDDYEAKMKRQYDDIVRKFRNDAKKELGAEFTETEFQAWWASKPTFITFDQWLKEEEEMKRMGSKPCPVCEMENSVTAKICHKCGSVMGDTTPKKPEGKLPPKQEAKPAAQPQPKPQQAPAQPAPQPAQQQPRPQPAPAAPVPAQQAAPQGTPGKKGCPSCGMEVNANEKICPICNYDFSQPQAGGEVRRVIRKPIKKIVRRPGEPGGDQPQQ